MLRFSLCAVRLNQFWQIHSVIHPQLQDHTVCFIALQKSHVLQLFNSPSSHKLLVTMAQMFLQFYIFQNVRQMEAYRCSDWFLSLSNTHLICRLISPDPVPQAFFIGLSRVKHNLPAPLIPGSGAWKVWADSSAEIVEASYSSTCLAGFSCLAPFFHKQINKSNDGFCLCFLIVPSASDDLAMWLLWHASSSCLGIC